MSKPPAILPLWEARKLGAAYAEAWFKEQLLACKSPVELKALLKSKGPDEWVDQRNPGHAMGGQQRLEFKRAGQERLAECQADWRKEIRRSRVALARKVFKEWLAPFASALLGAYAGARWGR